MTSRESDAYHHELLREEAVDEDLGGYNCYVVRSVPKNPKDSQYSQVVTWVSMDIWMDIRMELYDRKGKLLKIMTADRIGEIQGNWTQMVVTMRNVQTGHSTRLEILKVVYGESLPDALFTTRFLQTGRVN